MDVIALHAAGFESAVATLGTAITQEHARMFSKYTKKVVINYDSDEAGQNAANKAMRILDEVGMEVRILNLVGAKDPDEFITKFGAAQFRQVLESSQTGFEYKKKQILSRYNLQSGDDKIKASNELCALVAQYYSPVEREVYLTQLSQALELPIEVLRNSVAHLRSRKNRELQAKQRQEAQSSVKHFGDRINPDAAKFPSAATTEEAVIGLLLLFEEHRNAVSNGKIVLDESNFVTAFYRKVFTEMMRLHQSEYGFSAELLGECFSPDEMGRIQRAMVLRQQLTENDESSLLSAVNALKRAKEKAMLQNEDITTRLAYLREKTKLHNGKADE